MNNDLYFKIAVSKLKGVGPVSIKKLIAYTGSIEGIFKEKKQKLLKIPGIGNSHIQKLQRKQALDLAHQEMDFMEANGIRSLFYLDSNYPQTLINCPDAPVLLYYKGNIDFNAPKILSIVGTRNASNYGKEQCHKLIEKLATNGHHPLIVSGLAYGIDINAHKAAIKYKLPTLAVLGHGLDTLYPAPHKSQALEISRHYGALLTEFSNNTPMDPKNFVKRNRIIAGIAHATIVVESAEKGGSLITAQIANSYNRDVLAFPGRTTDKFSSGCNLLIKTNQAHLIEGIQDMEYILGWNKQSQKPDATQQQLFREFSPEENLVIGVCKQSDKVPIDIISIKTSIPINRVSTLLLKLEFEGIIQAHPGKIYSLKA
ncbi:MAG: DNA-processing protein DprA [Marinifilaceae bacterium]